MSLKTRITLPLILLAFTIQSQIKPDSLEKGRSVTASVSAGTSESRELFQRKGRFFGYWGYNRSAYTKSNIHIWGDGYNFSITDVSAKDDPTTNFSTYVKPNSLSVPENNYRIGYYVSDKFFVSLGIDHMKYAINKQTTRLTGTVSKDNNHGANIGTYNNTEVVVGEGENNDPASIIDQLPKGFVSGFEHCDGLNDVSVDVGRLEQLWISKNHKMALAVVGALGLGMLVPDSDTDILGYPPKHDMNTGKKAFHLAGYSGSMSFGLQFDFCKNFFLLARLKGGYINLPDINTTTTGGKASQHFGFIEPMMVVGYTHSFSKK
jgi:hypothetical protein